MPEYLAPGVYVEETSFRAKSIEGVSTTTTGFIGPARYGPVDLEPDLITSLPEFERVYGDGRQLQFGDPAGSDLTEPMDNFLWHAVRAFFEEGGKRLYVVRTFRPKSDADDGRAVGWIPSAPADPNTTTVPNDRIAIRARFPGAAGRMRVRITMRLGGNVLGSLPDPDNPGQAKPTIGALLPGDVVWITARNPDGTVSGSGAAYRAQRRVDSRGKEVWTFANATTAGAGRGIGFGSPPDDLMPGVH